jgi:hypothetical protein
MIVQIFRDHTTPSYIKLTQTCKRCLDSKCDEAFRGMHCAVRLHTIYTKIMG